MVDDPGYRQTRQSFPDPAKPRDRNAFAAKLMDRLSWCTSNSGKRDMADKGYHPISVSVGVILSTLELSAEEGHCPLQVVEMALRQFDASNEPGDVGEAVERIGEILDHRGAQVEDSAQDAAARASLPPG